MIASMSFAIPRTKIGIHCPTAPVQIVRETKSACCVVRAPKLGDKDFKQCQCAEKKAGKQEVEKDVLISGGYRFTFVENYHSVVRFELRHVESIKVDFDDRQLIDVPSEPFIPPPNFI